MTTLIEKEFDIDQPIDRVWKSLADPEDIVVCVPGASITEKIDDRNYKGEVVTKFGPIKVKYNGDIEIVELDEASRKMVLKGRGLDSKGKGSADLLMNGTLEEKDGKTNVKFSMQISIVGKLAQFGSRLIKDVSEQLLEQFVGNFRNKLGTAAPSIEPEVAAAKETPAAVTSQVAVNAAAEEKAKVVTQHTVIESPSAEEAGSALDATKLAGTVAKSFFGSFMDFVKSIFGGKKS